MDPVDRRAKDVARASKHSKVDEDKGQVELDRKIPNLYIIMRRKIIKEAKIAEGATWKQPVPPQAPVVVYQSNQWQPAGSGQRGRGQEPEEAQGRYNYDPG